MAKSLTGEEKVLRLAGRQPILRAREVARAGIPTVALSRLVDAGTLVRLGRGLYGLPNQSMSAGRGLAEAAIRIPRAVVCLLSALQAHGIGTQAPFQVWLALPQGMTTPRSDNATLRIVHMSPAMLEDGVMHMKFDGVRVPVFNAAKTVVDCFRFRNKIGLDVALEALRDGWRKRQFTLDALWRHAATGRMTNVMRPYIESLVA